MKLKKILALGTVSSFAALAPGLNAAEAEVKADIDLPKTEARTEIDRDRDLTGTVAKDSSKVRAANKASGLLGMEVRNNNNEKLGEIKDLVMDLNSGKVSYAVLAVGGFLGIGEKLIALPPSALAISDDFSHLRLDADKSRIQAAPGFAATAWPNVDDPQINAFWRGEAVGGAAGSEIRRDTSRSGVDVDVDRKNLDTDVKIDAKKDKIYTDADEKNVEVEVKKD